MQSSFRVRMFVFDPLDVDMAIVTASLLQSLVTVHIACLSVNCHVRLL